MDSLCDKAVQYERFIASACHELIKLWKPALHLLFARLRPTQGLSAVPVVQAKGGSLVFNQASVNQVKQVDISH